MEIAEQQANEGRLVTFGIVPTYAETGYGYIKATGPSTFRSVDEFLEKPDACIAQAYVDSGDYFWNSGMFMFKASVYVNEVEKYAPEMMASCREALSLAETDLDFIRVDKGAFEKCPNDSIDYAVMEKTDSAVMVPLDAGWSDVGSWASLWAVCDKDAYGNVVRGDVVLDDTENCYIQSEGKLIATVGLQDAIVVQTDDRILVAAKEKVQDVKGIVSKLNALGR